MKLPKFKLFNKVIDDYKDNENNFKSSEMLNIYSELKPKNIFDLKKQKQRLLNKYFPLSTILVNMQLNNGSVIQFIIKVDNLGFKFDNGYYIIDDSLKYYNASSGLWCFDYHEELCFPIKRTIQIKSLINNIIASDELELETAINPQSLQKFMESSVIQKILAGGQLEDSLKLIRTLIIIIAIFSCINIIISLKLAGVF